MSKEAAFDQIKDQIKQEAPTAASAVERLKKIISLLRSEEGCPWDKVQDYKSIATCLIDETYEVVDAVDREDWDNLEEELGDVLLQVVFYSDMGQDDGRFDLKTVANRVSEKMIRRHPHVFSGNRTKSVDIALEKWENVKKIEKLVTTTESMRQVPKSLPALRKSVKIQEKASQVGFDWKDVGPAFSKLTEESEELREAYLGETKERMQHELGDVLFAATNIARFLEIDPEEALNSASDRFVRRFAYIEDEVLKMNGDMKSMTLEELDRIWEEAKKQEAGQQDSSR